MSGVAGHPDPDRVAFYLRVSTTDQTSENQRPDLLAMAEARGWPVVAEYTDEGESAWVAGSATARPAMADLMLDAHKGRFKRLLVWDLSRLTREGPEVAHGLVRVLQECGVELTIWNLPGFSLQGLMGEVVVGVYAAMDKAASDTLSARVRAGMARSRAAGRHQGRPRSLIDEAEVVERVQRGEATIAIARDLGIPRTTLTRRIADLRSRGVLD